MVIAVVEKARSKRMIKRAKTTVEGELTPREIAEVIIDMTCDEQVDVLRDLADCHTFHRADFVMQLKYIVEALEKLPPTNKRRIKGMFDTFLEYIEAIDWEKGAERW